MKMAAKIVQMLIRLAGLILILLGLLFWTGHELNWIPFHMWLGVAFVFLLWTEAALAVRARVSPHLVILAAVWGFVVASLGMMQDQLLTGSTHWVIQLLHLLIGAGAIGVGESLAARIHRSRPSTKEPRHKPRAVTAPPVSKTRR